MSDEDFRLLAALSGTPTLLSYVAIQSFKSDTQKIYSEGQIVGPFSVRPFDFWLVVVEHKPSFQCKLH